MSYRVHIEKATADYRIDRPEAPLMVYARGKAKPVRCAAGDGYQAEMAYLGKCIRTMTAPSGKASTSSPARACSAAV